MDSWTVRHCKANEKKTSWTSSWFDQARCSRVSQSQRSFCDEFSPRGCVARLRSKLPARSRVNQQPFITCTSPQHIFGWLVSESNSSTSASWLANGDTKCCSQLKQIQSWARQDEVYLSINRACSLACAGSSSAPLLSYSFRVQLFTNRSSLHASSRCFRDGGLECVHMPLVARKAQSALTHEPRRGISTALGLSASMTYTVDCGESLTKYYNMCSS
jgi:hypothetical protein